MNAFQIIALVSLTFLVGWEVWHAAWYRSDAILRLMRLGCWIAAICVVVSPELATRLAALTGIGRGSDLVLYVAILVLVAGLFCLLTRQIALERRIIELVRVHAIEHARLGENVSIEKRISA